MGAVVYYVNRPKMVVHVLKCFKDLNLEKPTRMFVDQLLLKHTTDGRDERKSYRSLTEI